MFGHQGVIPGVTDGNPATMEPVTVSDSFRNEFVNRQKSEELYRKVDANERIQKALAQNTQGYSGRRYSEGELVLFKEDGKSRWSGPAHVTGMEGSKVRLVQDGYDRTVHACRVMPYKDDRFVVDENVEDEENPVEQKNVADDESIGDMPDTSSDRIELENIVDAIDAINDEDEAMNKDVRPKLHSRIAFKVIGDDEWKTGKVSAVGKKQGNQKFLCWIKNKNIIDNYDFVKDISCWNYCKVEFAHDSKTVEETGNTVTEILYTGVWFLQNKESLEEEAESVYHTKIPLKYHNEPEVVEAKAAELDKWIKYNAYEVVDHVNQHVLGSRYVIEDKNGKVKARFVVKGNEERGDPRSDSPTASKDSFKTFLALSANEEFEIKSLDVSCKDILLKERCSLNLLLKKSGN